eukprot:1889495-Prymnesium_polylepis.1
MAMRSARKAAARPPRSLWHGDQWSPCQINSPPRLGFSPSAPIAGAALRVEPVASAKPVSVVKNLSRGL